MTEYNTPELSCRVEFGDVGQRARDALVEEYRSTLAGPPDDMWSAFADQADQAALTIGDELVGSAAVDADGLLHRFFIRVGFEHLAASMLDRLRRTRPVRSIIVSTGDPGALSALLPIGRDAVPVALLYTHRIAPVGGVLDELASASPSDHERASAFVRSATEGAVEFIDTYLAERIHREELILHEIDGSIVAIGECRLDANSTGYAHLGMVVGREHRGRHVGSRMMNSLVEICGRTQLTPLCSTEPDNLPAHHVIRRAGFGSRHTVFRMAVAAAADDGYAD